MFQLTFEEKKELVAKCDHLTKLKFSKTLPYAFTEHGAIMAANVLNSRGAINMSVQSVAEIDMQSRFESFSQLDDSMLFVVYGQKDDIIDPTPIPTLIGLSDNIRTFSFPDSKHFPMLDEASKFNRLIRDFLTDVGNSDLL